MEGKEIELLTDESLSKKLIKKWFWLYFFWYLAAPVWYITRLIISNSPNVSVSDFWLMYGIISFITLLYTYNDLWLTESLQFFLPRFNIHKEYNNIKTAIWFSLATEITTWIMISIGLRFWSNRLSIHYFHDENASTILKYFCFYFIWTNVLQVLQSIFRAFQKTFEYQLSEFIKAASILVFTTICFFLDGDIESYSLCRIIWLGITIIITRFLYKKYRKPLMRWFFCLKKFIIKDYVKYALRAFIWIWIWGLFWQIILQMVIFFLWSESAWYYSNFLSLFSIWVTIIWPIISLIFPIASELYEKDNKDKLWQLISYFYNYFSIIILSFSILFIIFGTEISTILFWIHYLASWILLQYIGIFLPFNLLASFNYGVLSGIGKVKERVIITCLSCILTIILWYIGIKNFGILWAGFAFWLSNVFNWALSFILLKKQRYSLSFKWEFSIKNIILLTILWLSIYLIKTHFIDINENRLYTLLKVISIWLFYYGFIILINQKEFKNLLKT